MYTYFIQSVKILVSFFSWAGWFESTLVANPEEMFSCDVAHMVATDQSAGFQSILHKEIALHWGGGGGGVGGHSCPTGYPLWTVYCDAACWFDKAEATV